MLVNVPLAYLFSWPFSAMHEQLFVPSFIIGYWLTNLLGLVMLHQADITAQPLFVVFECLCSREVVSGPLAQDSGVA